MNSDFVENNIELFEQEPQKELLSLEQEEQIYKLLNTSRKYFHSTQEKKRVDFFQLWQQKAMIADYKACLDISKPFQNTIFENVKDRLNNNTLFILPQMNKVIRVNFRKGIRADLGWVEYDESLLK